MTPTRYRQARTLVRRPCRLPGEAVADFRTKVARLRVHFEQFNRNAAEICQWLFSLRKQYGPPGNPVSFGVLGDFLLSPALEGPESSEADLDRIRLGVFDDVLGLQRLTQPGDRPLPGPLREAMTNAAEKGPQTDRAKKTLVMLFERLRVLEPAHRLVLLKSAAEWIVGRYRRGLENWIRNHEEWEKEKREWESEHPKLTEAVRARYTQVFRELNDPSAGKPGVRRKRPRICTYERQKGNLDNCVYAGEKGHGPLCWKYSAFVKDRKEKSPRFNPKGFEEDAAQYLPLRAGGLLKRRALSRAFRNQASQQRFDENWTAYLRAMNLNESTVVEQKRLPHCLKIGKTFEESECTWNPHTVLCREYKGKLDGFDATTRALEKDYREWRGEFLAGPRKPRFQYPSADNLPLPKIFGAGFHRIDFDRSILRLRLDDMPAGEWIEFGFVPWPRDYRPSRDEVREQVTSVHVHFVGKRPRFGFRFDVPHSISRFDCTQDELDELRSRKFPRQSQDQEFLNAARSLLLKSFPEKTAGGRELPRLLTVDLGDKGAAAAVFEGREWKKDLPLPILKINRLYASRPEKLEPDAKGRPTKRELEKDDSRGLVKEHVGRHLGKIAEGTATIAPYRRRAESETVPPGPNDFRGLKRHVAWMIRDWARLNARRIVAAAEEQECDLIVLESLRGFRPPGYDRLDEQSQAKKLRLGFFAFGRVRRKVVEKAVERGMRVVTVPYLNSSQVCWMCGRQQLNKGLHRKNKQDRKFVCEYSNCKQECDSDANAARVLGRVFWNEIQLPVRRADGRGG